MKQDSGKPGETGELRCIKQAHVKDTLNVIMTNDNHDVADDDYMIMMIMMCIARCACQRWRIIMIINDTLMIVMTQKIIRIIMIMIVMIKRGTKIFQMNKLFVFEV